MQVSNLGEAQLNRSSVFLDGLCHISEVNCRSAFETGWLLFLLKGGDQIKYLSSSGKLTQACSHGGWTEDKESKWKHEVCLKQAGPDLMVHLLYSVYQSQWHKGSPD